MILDFNADWRFYKADGSCRTVHLPHDAMLEEPRRKTAKTARTAAIFRAGNMPMKRRSLCRGST